MSGLSVGFINIQAPSAVVTPPTWVAGGNGSHSLETSVTGTGWTPRGTPLDSLSVGQRDVNAVGRSPSLWAAGGRYIITSSDGITWTQRTSVFDGGLVRTLLWNGSFWIAAGLTSGAIGKLATSTDGITWTTLAGTFGTPRCLVWNGGSYLLCNEASSTVWTSPDATTWTAQTGQLTSTLCAVWVGSQWIVGGFKSGNKTIQTSPDGITWTLQSTPLDSSGSFGLPMISGLAWDGSTLVGVGRQGDRSKAIITSADGVSWTYQASGLDGQDGEAIAWDGTLFAAGGGTGGSTGVIVTSSDGSTWTPRTQSLGTVFAVATHSPILYGGDFGAGTDGLTGGLVISSDAASATESASVVATLSASDSATATDTGSLPPSPATLVAVSNLDSANPPSVAVSSDNLTFTSTTLGVSPTPVGSRSRVVAYNGSQWLVYCVWNDGATWTGKIFTSSDGNTWDQQTSALDYSSASSPSDNQGGRGACWDGTQWVVVGLDGSNAKKCVSSTDGVTWTTQGNPTAIPYGIAYSSSLGLYVICGAGGGGQPSLCSSPDLSTWTTRQTGQTMNDIAWNGTGFLAVANGGIYGSHNGIGWSTHTQPWGTGSPSRAIASVVWNGSRFVAVGRNGGSLTSTVQRSPSTLGSWVVSFAGHRSTNDTLSGPPSGMTNQSNIEGASADAAGHDTGGGMVGWGDTTVTTSETSSGWVSTSLELLGSSVSRISTNAVEASSMSMPTHATGDLLVMFAFRNGSTTAPSLPAGWTNVTTVGANSCSGRLGYKIAASASETSGTWTNATTLNCHVYRGASVGGGLNYGLTTGSGSTVTYAGLLETSYSWTAASNNPFTQQGSSIVYDGTTHFAVAAGNDWATSSDGNTWTDQGTINADLSTSSSAIFWIACYPNTSIGGRS